MEVRHRTGLGQLRSFIFGEAEPFERLANIESGRPATHLLR